MGQPMHVFPSDDEWEYEYDATETEDYYFTLDLSTHVPKVLSHPARKSNQPTENAAAVRDGEQAEWRTAAGRSLSEDAIRSAHQIQITDLHTENPLVKFDEAIYNCYWATDLGTQFHISQAGATSNPRRSGTALDVVGTSQTRLIGKPAELVPREGRRRLATLGKILLNAIPVNDDSDDDGNGLSTKAAQPISAHAVVGEPLKISRESCKDAAAEAQASFLERLSAIKLRKGEKDQVPVINVRVYEAPENADELREAALAKDAEQAKRRKEPEVQARERKKRRRITNAERGIPEMMDSTSVPSAAGRRSRAAIAESIGFQEPAGVSSMGDTSTLHSQDPDAENHASLQSEEISRNRDAADSIPSAFSTGEAARNIDPELTEDPTPQSPRSGQVTSAFPRADTAMRDDM